MKGIMQSQAIKCRKKRCTNTDTNKGRKLKYKHRSRKDEKKIVQINKEGKKEDS